MNSAPHFSSAPLVARVVRALIEWRWPLLILGLALTVSAWWTSRRLGFDRSIENMFVPDDPLLAPYHTLRRTFGADEVVVAAYRDKELLSAEGRARLARLTQALAATPGVASVLSLNEVLGTATPTSESRALDVVEGYLIGRDRVTTAVVCVLTREPSATADDDDRSYVRAATIDELRRVVRAHDAEGMLLGEPVMVVDGFRFIEDDAQRLVMISAALLTATIVLCFRSVRWVLIPLVIVFATLYWTEALLVASGLRLSMISAMLSALVLVIVVGTLIHVVIQFRQARDEGRSPRQALEHVTLMLAMPIVWVCLTDAAGFGSLLFARLGPVHDFGLMMALASVLAIAAVALLLPGLALAGTFDADPQHAWGERRLGAGLEWLVTLIERRPWTLATGIAIVVATLGIGCRWLTVETDFTRNFRRDSPIARSYEFVETHLGGAGVWDALIPAPERITGEFLARVRRLETRLRDEVLVPAGDGEASAAQRVAGLTKVFSLVDVLDASPLGAAAESLPEPLLRATLAAFATQQPDLQRSLLGVDPRDGRQYLRIVLRSNERQPAEAKHAAIAAVARICAEEFPATEQTPSPVVTGYFVLLANLIESVLGDQWLTFGIATAGCGVLMMFAFRSVALSLIALVPNVVPIVMVMGLLGWSGIRMNMGAALIAAVSMGLAIDSSVHFISAYRRRRMAGISLREALHAVEQGVGRAMIFSILALIIGFCALAFSDFVPTIYFGVLVSLTMFGGLLGNVILLPLLLTLAEPILGWPPPRRA